MGTVSRWLRATSLAFAAVLAAERARAQMPAHPNPNAELDEFIVTHRGDVIQLPNPLKHRLGEMAERPHTFLPIQAFAEADKPSQLFQYYLLDSKSFQPNVFSAVLPGQNDQAQLTAFGCNGGIPTIGSVRVVVEPKPGLPTDPNNVRAFIDLFTDLSCLFVINNESGWYEGWMIHDITVPNAAPPRADGHAQFGMLLDADVKALAKMGMGNNKPGAIFTMDGNAVHFPSAQTNVVPIQESMGAYNAMQQSDVHSYWEFNYEGTNWIHPLYELPFTPAGSRPRSRTAIWGSSRRSSPARARRARRTRRSSSATIPTRRATPIASKAPTPATPSASSASAAFPAASPTRSISTCTSASSRSSPGCRSRSACSTPTRPRSPGSTPTAMA